MRLGGAAQFEDPLNEAKNVPARVVVWLDQLAGLVIPEDLGELPHRFF